MVDAAQGIVAQTLANTYLAVDLYLESFRSSTRSTMPAADPRKGADRAEDSSACPPTAPCDLGLAGLKIERSLKKSSMCSPRPEGRGGAFKGADLRRVLRQLQGRYRDVGVGGSLRAGVRIG